MKKFNKLERIGMALEGFGATITTCGIADLSRTFLITGVLVSAIGRAMTMYFKENA